MAAPTTPRPIPLWKLVGGAFLHFGLLAYLVLVPLAVLLLAPAGASTEPLLMLALRVSGLFLALLVLLGTSATLVAAIVDRGRAARPTPETAPALESRRQLVSAAETARRQLDHSAAVQVAALTAGGWDHEDHRYQALARDLDHVVATAAAAIGSAAADRRPLILRDMAAAVSHLGEELIALNEARARTEEAAARTAALYIENRYGRPDFSIPPS